MGAYEYLRSDDTVVGKAGKAIPKSTRKRKTKTRRKQLNSTQKNKDIAKDKEKKTAMPCPAQPCRTLACGRTGAFRHSREISREGRGRGGG